MRFETIIIGGGLSALVAGISLQKAGRKTLIVSEGQSALHFFSGSFDLIAAEDDQLPAIKALDAGHPYSKLGADEVMRLAAKVQPFFAEMGFNLIGVAGHNHLRTSPLGETRPTWLTVEDTAPMDRPVDFPMSSLGVRMQITMRLYYEKLGGTFLTGDTVVRAKAHDGHVSAIYTANHGYDFFEADNFILATGSFFSRGLLSSSDKVWEPVFGLDVDWEGPRSTWFAQNTFDEQPYMKFGVHTNADFRPSVNGKEMDNLYAIGSVLSGANAIKQGCGGGIAILTALAVAEKILKEESR